MPTVRFKQVDVFTRTPFLGNPVAVVLDAENLHAEQMQRIAAWTNLSETTYVLPPSSNDADYCLKIFTPKQELPFAGHPTIGSAHAVLESGFATAHNGHLRQECLAGIIDLTVEQTENGQLIFLATPKAKIVALDAVDTQSLAAALGLANALTEPALRIDVGVVWLIANLGSAETVAMVEPNLEHVRKISTAHQAAGVTVFGRARDGASKMQVRSFAPALGVAEDPVCGSGNASVAAYMVHTGSLNEIGSEYSARQGMQIGRDGHVAVTVRDGVIRIGGHAVTCVTGMLRLD